MGSDAVWRAKFPGISPRDPPDARQKNHDARVAGSRQCYQTSDRESLREK
jgi:hypothetical protein